MSFDCFGTNLMMAYKSGEITPLEMYAKNEAIRISINEANNGTFAWETRSLIDGKINAAN